MPKLGRVLTRVAKPRRAGRLLALGLAVVVLAALGGAYLAYRARTASAIPGDSNVAVAPLEVASPSPPSTTLTSGERPAEKLVALTFDDGPGPYTQKVAQVLEKDKAAGTFFFIGRQIAKYRGIVSELKAQGFELEDHTWDHATLTKLNAAQVRLEISRTQQALGGATYVRPPSGSYDATVLAVTRSLGLKLILWNVDTLDWKYRSVASILTHVRWEVHPGDVILMHDGGGNRSQTVAALPIVIDWLRAQGYTLVRVDQLGAKARPGTIKS